MRNSDGTLIGNLDDNIPANISVNLLQVSGSTLDENQTVYDLLPVIVNQPPIITDPITTKSQPPIKTYNAVDSYGSDFMYLHLDGTIKAIIGSTINFNIEGEQPSSFNIDNGLPVIKKPNAELGYVWNYNGERLENKVKESLNNSTQIINNTKLEITNVQPQDAGEYVCEISNDAGVTSSEIINLEVFNPDIDSFFYRNLIQNPFGKDGADNWNASSDDFTTKTFAKTETIALKYPTQTNLFGYNPETLHPRPYQVDTDMLKGVDYVKNLDSQGTYFTRSRYKYVNKGGSHFVKAYQDIDLTDIQPFIKGGVFGVDGVRAIFSCYIGNAISYFQPTNLSVLPRDRSFCFEGAPRVSVENFVTAGRGKLLEKAYVTIDEYDRETKLVSNLLNEDGSVSQIKPSITLVDPWTKRLNKYYGRRYYDNDFLGLGTLSTGDTHDALLFVADELVPDQRARFNFGQYAEHNKVILDRLNPKTNKIRVTINFETNDDRLYDLHLNLLEESDEIFEYAGWQQLQRAGTFIDDNKNNQAWSIIRQDVAYAEAPRKQIVPLAGDPRVMMTGLNLSLIPIERFNPQCTEYYTKNAFVLNNTKAQTTLVNYNNAGWTSFRRNKLQIG